MNKKTYPNLGIPIAVGDIITTYHAGCWRLKEIQRRFVEQDDLRFDCYKNKKIGDERSPLFVYEQVLTKDFKPSKRKTQSCDASYCQKMTKEFVDNMKKEYIDCCDRLIGLL